jgi:hypothetical protein
MGSFRKKIAGPLCEDQPSLRSTRFLGHLVCRDFHESPWVRLSRSPERHGLIRGDVPDFNGFVSQKRFMDRTYFPKLICDQRFVRLEASFRRPLPRNQSPESGFVRHILPNVGGFVRGTS